MNRLRAAAPVLLVLLAACGRVGAPRAETAAIIDTIKADEVHWNADYRNGDAKRIAAHFAPNAKLMAPGQAPLVGTAAIEAAVGAMVAGPGFSLSFASDKVDVAASGDLAAARGTFKQTVSDPKTQAPMTTTGSFIAVYKPRPGGGWMASWVMVTPEPIGAPIPATP